MRDHTGETGEVTATEPRSTAEVLAEIEPIAFGLLRETYRAHEIVVEVGLNVMYFDDLILECRRAAEGADIGRFLRWFDQMRGGLDRRDWVLDEQP